MRSTGMMNTKRMETMKTKLPTFLSKSTPRRLTPRLPNGRVSSLRVR
jgi:hypothetical protein